MLQIRTIGGNGRRGSGGGDGERVLEGIGVLESDAFTCANGRAIVDEAIIELDPAEDSRIDELCRCEPSTRHVDVRHGGGAGMAAVAAVITVTAHVQDLDAKRGDATRHGARSPLQYDYIGL